MAVWSKKVKILSFLVVLTIIAFVVWLFLPKNPTTTQINPQAVLEELTLGEVGSTNNVSLPDPQLDAVKVYVVATDAEAALKSGITTIKSKQEIIGFYTDWFRDNGWNLNSSVQVQPSLYLMSAQKEGEGTMQINMRSEHSRELHGNEGEDHSHDEVSGTIQVLIMYGFGR